MKPKWILFQNGIEMLNGKYPGDGYTIYHDIGFVILRKPDKTLEKFRSTEQAKRYVDELETIRPPDKK